MEYTAKYFCSKHNKHLCLCDTFLIQFYEDCEVPAEYRFLVDCLSLARRVHRNRFLSYVERGFLPTIPEDERDFPAGPQTVFAVQSVYTELEDDHAVVYPGGKYCPRTGFVTQSVDPVSTTIFTENEPTVNDEGTVELYRDFYSSLNEDVHGTVQKYLSKPFRVGTYSWSTAATPNSNVVFFNDSWSIVSLVPAWLEKLRGFQGIKATLCLRVSANTGPYSAGRLRLCYYPAGDANQRKVTIHTSNLIPVSQLPGIDLDACRPEAQLRIPYKTPLQYYNMTENSVSWGSVFLKVVAPYRTGPDNAQSVDVALWAWLEDVSLYGQTHPGLVTQGIDSKPVASEMESKPISKIFSGMNQTLRGLSSIPLLKSLLGTPIWVTNALAQTAFTLGYSKPASAMTFYRNAIGSLQNMANCDGERAGNSLSLSSDAKLMPIDDLSYTGHDETSFNFIKTRKSLWRTFQMVTAPTQPTGTLLYEELVTPLTYDLNLSTTENYATPVNYLGSWFAKWRGAITYELVFCKTKFHRGTVAITFQPGPSVAATLDNGTYLYREIFDLEQSNVIRFTVPFINGFEFLPLAGNSGRLSILVVNPLQAPETVSQTIDVLVYVEGHESLQFAQPKVSTYTSTFVTQSIDLSEVHDIGFLGGSTQTTFNVESSARCTSELPNSILQLAKRHFPVFIQRYGVPAPLALFFGFNPWTLTTAGSPVITQPGNMAPTLTVLAAPFAFMRGGMEVNVNNSAQTNPIQDCRLTTLNKYFRLLGASGFFEYDAVTYCSNVNGGLLLEVPYYNVARASQIELTLDTINEDVPFTTPGNIIAFSGDANTAVTRAVADDFQFLFFVGIPRLSTVRVTT